MHERVIQGVVLRTYQGSGFGGPWFAELWDDANATRLYRSLQQPDQYHAVERAELFAARFGYAIVVRRTGRFSGKIKL